MATEGADVIAVDLAGPLPASVRYDSPTPEDLAETARLVEKAGGRVVWAAADIRDLRALRDVVDAGVAEFGRLDVIVANAGICCHRLGTTSRPRRSTTRSAPMSPKPGTL